MRRIFNLKPVVNKSNGQIAFHPSRKELPPKLLKDLPSIKKVKFYLESWE
jgi:hypothetical protein